MAMSLHRSMAMSQATRSRVTAARVMLMLATIVLTWQYHCNSYIGRRRFCTNVRFVQALSHPAPELSHRRFRAAWQRATLCCCLLRLPMRPSRLAIRTAARGLRLPTPRREPEQPPAPVLPDLRPSGRGITARRALRQFPIQATISLPE